MENYVVHLEQKAATGPPFRDWESFSCLACDAASWERWAGPIAAARFEECRKSPFRDRIAQACLTYMNQATADTEEWFQPRLFAAELLAYYGVGKIADHDVFLILAREEHPKNRLRPTRLMALASLQDPRTIGFLATAYDSLRLEGGRADAQVVINILNCLYHLPGGKAIELASRIRENEDDPDVRSRAERVIHR